MFRPATLSIVLLSLLQDPSADAKRAFEAGDYPAAEAALLRAISALPAGATAERAWRLAQLAETRLFQGIVAEARRDIEAALALEPSPRVRRTAASVYLRSRRYREAMPHIEALLAAAPRDPSLAFLRGVVRAKEGRFEEALADLAQGLEAPEARRDARFELALALARLERPRQAFERLREILEEDPHDAEACWQAARQLLRIGGEGPSRAAALLTRYFESVRKAEGASSRDQHLAFTGKTAEAALVRAAKWERLGRYDRVLEDLGRAGPGEHLAAFWRRMGFERPPRAEEVRTALSAAAAGDAAEATRIARLLLALEPRSAPALRTLLEGTRDPSLVVPRLHYARRMAEVEPANPRWQEELTRTRAEIAGTTPPR